MARSYKNAAAISCLAAAAFVVEIVAACGQQESCGNIKQPPAVFDHAPALPVFIIELSSRQIDARCHSMEGNKDTYTIFACSQQGGGIIPRIFLPTLSGQITRAVQDCLLHHEWGHVNGWPADHRGGV